MYVLVNKAHLLALIMIAVITTKLRWILLKVRAKRVKIIYLKSTKSMVIFIFLIADPLTCNPVTDKSLIVSFYDKRQE